MMKKLCFLFVLCFASATISFSQSNDCDISLSTGFQLTVGSSCNPTTFNSNNATKYWTSNYTCNAGNRDDAWGYFTATSTTTVITYNSVRDAILTLFTGVCNPNMTSLACSDSTTSGDETITYATTIGTIYMVRIQRYNTNNSMNGTICVYNPPANDSCSEAISLGISTNTTCTTSLSGTTTGATQSLAAVTCGSTGNADDDVWYSFIATGTSHTVTVTPGTLTDAVIDVRTGGCNGSNFDCENTTTGTNAESLILTGLTIGTTYYARVYSQGGNGNQGTFDICVTTQYNPCNSITPITVPCGTDVTLAFASGNGTYNLNSCTAGGTPGIERIFSYTPTLSGYYRIQQNSSFGFINYFYKTQAAGCNANGWTCVGSLNGSATSGSILLIAGTTYYFLIDPTVTTGGNVNLNLACPPSPPSNDNCAAATSLTVSPNTSCTTSISATTISATQSLAAINCGGTGNADDDVWFRFVATSTAHTVTVTPGTLSNAVIDVRSGACNGTNIACVDSTTGSNAESLTLTGLTPTTTYYVRVYSFGDISNQGTFDICVTTPADPCANITNISSCNTIVNTFIPAGNGVYSPGNCSTATPGREQIYSFTPTTTGNYNLQHNVSTTVVNYFYKVAGTCNNTGWTCIGRVSGAATSAPLALTAGTTYYFMVDSEAITGDTINFSISCPSTPATNGTCATATNLPCDTSNLFGSTSGTTNITHGTGCSMSNFGVWYSFTGEGTETTISVVPYGGYNIEFAVVSGNCASFTNIRCQDIRSGKENYTFTTTSGVVYYVYVAQTTSGSTSTGNFTISRTCPSPCALTPIVNTPTCGVIAGGLGLNGGDPPSINCSTSDVAELEANYIKLGNTTSYRVEQIPFNPPATGSIFALSGLLDDTWSAELSLLFAEPFCFYGNSYTNFVYGANGMITFDTSRASAASGYEFDEGLPSTDEALFLNTIYGVYHDIDPSVGGTIGRRVEVVNGCRRMIIVWEDVPMYWNNAILFSGKMVLYEKTNIIEVYIQEKRIDSNAGAYPVGPWNYGNAIVGLQGGAGDAITAPCRNGTDANWTVTTGEAWRFVPNNGNITQLKWYANGVHLPAYDNDDTPSISTTATTTYTAEVTYTPTICGAPFTISDDVLVTVNDKVWNGSENTNWYVDNNWTPTGIPTIIDCVTIPPTDGIDVFRQPIANVLNAPAAPDDVARAKYVRVLGGANLEVAANTFLEIDEWLNNAGDVLFRDTASLIQLTNVASNNNTGNIRYQRAATGVGSQNYVYWSSPVEGFNVGSINTAASELRFEWQPTTAAIYGNWIPASGVMSVGKGYIVRGLATPPSPIPASTAEFVGRPSNGIINTPISRGNYTSDTPYPGPGNTMATKLDDNWNLIGNPYPSAISADAFITTNSALLDDRAGPIFGTIYLWQRSGLPSSSTDPFYADYAYNYMASNYLSYNMTGPNPTGFDGNIAAGQAFFIQMDDVPSVLTTNVTFDNTMRSTSQANDNFLRTVERNRIWLDLINPSNMAVSTLVGYIQEATNDIDRLYDGYELSDVSMKLYSLIGDEKMAIQGRALPFDDDDRVPLGFVIPLNGTYKIAVNSLDGLFIDVSQTIYLEDTYLNTIYDLRTNPYSFTSTSGTFNDRFILRYTNETLSTPEQVANFGFNIIGLKDYVRVTSTHNPINTVIVYDVLGRVLADYKDINALEFKLDLATENKGTLIIKATLYNGQQQVKKVIY